MPKGLFMKCQSFPAQFFQNSKHPIEHPVNLDRGAQRDGQRFNRILKTMKKDHIFGCQGCALCVGGFKKSDSGITQCNFWEKT